MRDEFIFEFTKWNTNTRLHDELFLILSSESYTRLFYNEIFLFLFLILTLKYPKSSEKLVTIAYVLLKTELGSEESVIEELKKLEQIKRVERTFGDYDMVVKMEAEHIEKIREIIAWNIQKMKTVRATRTLIKKDTN